MKQRLMLDLKEAMKENNLIKKNTIQLIRAAILQKEKDDQVSLTNSDIEDIIYKEKKKRLDALAQYEKSNRTDLVEQTMKEIGYIDKYLPQPATEYEIYEKVKSIIVDLNATGKDFGQVIRKAKQEFGNRADGKLLSNIVKELLNS